MAFDEYSGRTVVVTGASSGIGKALAESLVALGAHVHALSRRPSEVEGATFTPLDLNNPSSIDRAAAGLPVRIDALFNCAGALPMAAGLDILRVNFLGTRLLTEQVLDRMSSGAGVVNVSSDGGYGWRKHRELVLEFLAEPTVDAGIAWYEKNEEKAGHPYAFSKEALNVWSMQQAVALAERGIRVNTSSPGAVQTPMLESIEAVFPAEMISAVEHPSGRRSSAQEQVGPLLFLNSDGASYVSGADIVVDGGFWATQNLEGTLWN